MEGGRTVGRDMYCTCAVVYLYNCFRQFEVVKYSEDDIEEVLPPGRLVEVAIGLHDLKHHSQPPEREGGRKEGVGE